MKLSVYSLKKILFDGEARSVNCKTAVGEITILDHHKPLISAIIPCVIKIVDKDIKEHYIPVSSGFLQTHHNHARCIVDESTTGT